MAHGKVRIAYAVMTKRGNLTFFGVGGPHAIFKTKKQAQDHAFPAIEQVVRVTIDTDD